ncbi:MAG TPA: hypothetical protein VK826_11240 [Bacteroidia bacterium]|nr:hypothetical protein [Bacteroidia bacterium]
MRKSLLFLLFLLFFVAGNAQRDYFMAEALIDQDKQAEAVKILDDLIDSNVYVSRPSMHMKTLNLAGSTKRFLNDSAGSKSAYRSAIAYYAKLNPVQKDDYTKREWYIAHSELASWAWQDEDYALAMHHLDATGAPGPYYSSTGHDVTVERDWHYDLRARIFQKQNQPDSAFHCLRQITENDHLRKINAMLISNRFSLVNVEGLFYGRNLNISQYPDAGYLYVLNLREDSSHAYQTVWFIHYAGGRKEIIGESSYVIGDTSGFPNTAFDISLSQNEEYLAVECEAKGANWIEIIDFRTLIKEHRCVIAQSITPYPGLVYITGWENNLLLISADIDLTKLNRKDHLSTQDLFGTIDDKKDFLFDPVEKKYSRK